MQKLVLLLQLILPYIIRHIAFNTALPAALSAEVV